MSVDPDTKALQNEIFWAKVERAKRMSIGERIAMGPRLFDEEMRVLRRVIALQNPQFTADDVAREVSRRLAIAKEIDDAGLYRDAGTIDDE